MFFAGSNATIKVNSDLLKKKKKSLKKATKEKVSNKTLKSQDGSSNVNHNDDKHKKKKSLKKTTKEKVSNKSLKSQGGSSKVNHNDKKDKKKKSLKKTTKEKVSNETLKIQDGSSKVNHNDNKHKKKKSTSNRNKSQVNFSLFNDTYLCEEALIAVNSQYLTSQDLKIRSTCTCTIRQGISTCWDSQLRF